MLVQKWTGVSLGQSVVSKVGKSFKLILVDLFDYTVVHWCQDRLFAREILVKVIHIPFGFLEMTTKCEKCVFFSSENMAAVETCAAQSGNTTVTVLAFSRSLLVNETVPMGVQTHDARFERWSDLPLLQQRPINLSEEAVKLDGLFQSLSHNAPQTLVRTLRHELKV